MKYLLWDIAINNFLVLLFPRKFKHSILLFYKLIIESSNLRDTAFEAYRKLPMDLSSGKYKVFISCSNKFYFVGGALGGLSNLSSDQNLPQTYKYTNNIRGKRNTSKAYTVEGSQTDSGKKK